MPGVYVKIKNASGTIQGPGPLLASQYESQRLLDKVGTFRLRVPVTDERISDTGVAEKYEAWAYTYLNGSEVELGKGIVDRIEYVEGRNPVLLISGDDLLRLLTHRTVGNLELYDVSSSLINPDEAYHHGPQEDPIVDDRMDEALDDDTGTYYEVAIQDDQFWYVGHSTKFSLVKVTIWGSYRNDNTADLELEYFGSALGWTDHAIDSDGTQSGGATLYQTGEIAYTRPTDWVPTTHHGVEKYWVRFRPTALLDTVRFAEIEVYPEIGSSTPVADVMAYAPAGWTVVDTGGSPEESDQVVHLQFHDESVFTALTMVAKDAGEHFYLGSGKTVVWLPTGVGTAESGLRAIRAGEAADLHSNTDACVITRLTRSQDSYNMISRVYPYGSGRGAARVTLAHSTLTKSGYTIDKTNNYIEKNGLGFDVRKPLYFPEIGTPYDEAVESSVSADTLLEAAYQYLERHYPLQIAYNLTVVKLDSTLNPGHTLRLDYRRYGRGWKPVDIDADVVVLGITTRIDASGRRTYRLEVSSTDLWPPTDNDAMVAHQQQIGQILGQDDPISGLSIITQFSSNVDIDGGTIDGTQIGADDPSSGTFTSLHATGPITTDSTIDGVDLAGFAAAQFLVRVASGYMANERVLTAGDGIDLSDGGAGGALTATVDVTDIIDTDYGLTESGGDIRLKIGAAFTFSTGYLVHSFSGNPSNITPDASASPGSSAYASRTDHVHGITCATPVAVDLAANAEGSASNFARSDHKHDLSEAITPTWSALHTFDAGLRVAAGQNLQLGTDVGMSRKAANVAQINTGDAWESETFTADQQGWRIGADGRAEFQDIIARGEIITAVFKYGEVSASAGTWGVWHSASTLYSDFTSVTAPSTSTLSAKNDLLGNSLFAVDDILRIKSFTGASVFDNWVKVMSVGTNHGDYTDYSVFKNSGSNTTFKTGTAVLDYGQSGDGFVSMTADGATGFGNAPNISVFTHAGSPWSVTTLRARLGNLNGVFGVASDSYGLAVGDYAGGNYLLYVPGADPDFEIHAGDDAWSVSDEGVVMTTGADWTELTHQYRFVDGSDNLIMYLSALNPGTPAVTYGRLYVLGRPGRGGHLDLQARAVSGQQALLELTAFELSGNETALQLQSGPINTATLRVGGNNIMVATVSQVTISRSLVVNEGGGDYDSRVESAANANMIFVDASANRVGIGMSNPAYPFDVNGAARVSGEFRVTGDLMHYRGGSHRIGYIFVPKAPGATSTSWDGDSKAVATYDIDTSASPWSLPAGVKAVAIRLAGRWSSINGGYAVVARQKNGSTGPIVCRPQEADIYHENSGIVPCDANGDIEIQVVGAAADCILEIHGYWV